MNKSFKTLAAAVLLGSTAIAPFAIAQDAGTGATTTPPAATGDATGTAPARGGAPARARRTWAGGVQSQPTSSSGASSTSPSSWISTTLADSTASGTLV